MEELFIGVLAAREFDVASRPVFAELGGVNVCQPGREDIIGAPPRSAFTLRFAFVLEFSVDDGCSNELPARALFMLVAGRDVFVGRDVTFEFERAAKLLDEPLARAAVKKRCELEGA